MQLGPMLRCCCLQLYVLFALVAVNTTASSNAVSSFRSMNSQQVYTVLRDLYNNGQMVELVHAAQQVIQENNTLVLGDLTYPTAYQYLGVAQYALGDLSKATQTFEQAVVANEEDVSSWIHLGNCYLYQMKLSQATTALEVAVLQKGATHEMHRLFKARNWMADWQDREEMLAQIEEKVISDALEKTSSGINSLDFVELPASMVLELSRQLHRGGGGGALNLPPNEFPLKRWQLHTPELRIGFISSDFGIHPVATLMRGMLAMLTRDKQEHNTIVYCFSLQTAGSWWKRNITRSIDHMVSLYGKDPLESAEIIREHHIHILVDLNGHTLHSGLPIMNYRPAPVQMSFLGYPMTTGSSAIDFFITDRVSTPVETSNVFFTEKMLVLPTHYIVNDHMQLLGHTLEGSRPSLSSVIGTLMKDRVDAPVVDPNAFVFATFSNWQKMDPLIFSCWMSIMARIPDSVLWFLQYSGHVDAKNHLQQEAMAHGIDGTKRLVFTPLAPWINHTFVKRAADLILDTSLKNGHTTMLDPLFAGVPVLTLEGTRMSNRAGSSALHSLGLQHVLTVHSYKEYVEVAVKLAATSNGLLNRLRATVEERRHKYPLFDTTQYTSQFSGALKSAWHVSKSRNKHPMHIFSPSKIKKHDVPIYSALGNDHTEDEYEVKVQLAIKAQVPILLHIGGQQPREGWWIVDVDGNREHVDFVMRMDNLYAFPDKSVTTIYASHVLEHVHYGVDRDVHRTLREWHRVLHPGGIVLIAVPDLMILSRLFVNETMSANDRFFVMRMMFGGQVDAHDVHKVGFDATFLHSFLTDAGFCDVKRVDSFDLFHDSSVAEFHNTRISLNVVARPCKKSSTAEQEEIHLVSSPNP